MAFNFGNIEKEGREFLKKATANMGTAYDEGITGRVVTAVFHTLRDQLSPEENLHLVSQLPLILKAVYVDGWKIKPKDRIRYMNQFLDDVRAHLWETDAYDLGDNQTARKRVTGVFATMRQYVSDGEWRHVAAQVPEELKSFIMEGELHEIPSEGSQQPAQSPSYAAVKRAAKKAVTTKSSEAKAKIGKTTAAKSKKRAEA